MNKPSKWKLSLLLVAVLSAVGGVAQATQEAHLGKVQFIRSHDISVSLDWFAVDTATSTSTTCPSSLGFVVFRLRDDDRGKRMLSLVTAAMLAGKTIQVYIDDGLKDPLGYCYVRYIDVSK
jgi:hypothetical protein